MKRINSLSVLFFLLMGLPLVQASELVDTSKSPVFQLGEDEAQLSILNAKYPALLIETYDGDMDKAYAQWQKVMLEMEKYAKSIDFNIQGVKMWINIYWSPEGKIDYIGYFLKPDSKNINTVEMNAFLKSFIRRDKVHATYSTGYFHNGSVSFPTHFTGEKTD